MPGGFLEEFFGRSVRLRPRERGERSGSVSSLASPSRRVFVTGGTGYLGRALLPELLARGHRVRALVRPGSAEKLPRGASVVEGNPLDAMSVTAALAAEPVDTVVHLVGVPKPSPAKAREFRTVDRAAIQATVAAITARPAGAPFPHLVFLSVAQPAPVMRAYVAVRAEAEALIRASGIPATCLRPWYVLGPGHRWPVVLRPAYALLRRLPATRATAERLGFVTLAEMTRALIAAVERPAAPGVRIVEVPEIRAAEI